MMTNSRVSIQEKPRNLNKKNPGKTYLPRFLDESDISTLKSSVDRELADIAMYMEKERQVVSKIVPGSIFKGKWDACTDKYPDPKGENSTWDVVVSCGETHDFDGKTWAVGQQLMWLEVSGIFVQRTNPSVEGIIEKVDKLEVKVDNANANISDLKLAVADTNFALAQTKQELEAKVNDNTSKITQTNEVVADLTKTVATQKTELESSIKGVKDVVDQNKAEGDKTDAEHMKLIVEAQSNINITNQTLADLDKTVATNKTELESKYQGVLTTVDGVQQEVTETKASLAQTNQTVADNKQAAAEATTSLKAEVDGKISGINQNMSVVVDKLGKVEAKWGVELNANGHISGIQMNNDGNRSNFNILTDRFTVTDGSTVKPPFAIENGKVSMRDVIITGHAEIVSGNLNIANNAIIYNDGRAVFKNADVSGAVRATSGEFNNVIIYETCDFRGTMSANNIVGDIYRGQFGGVTPKDIYTECVGGQHYTFLRIDGDDFDRAFESDVAVNIRSDIRNQFSFYVAGDGIGDTLIGNIDLPDNTAEYLFAINKFNVPRVGRGRYNYIKMVPASSRRGAAKLEPRTSTIKMYKAGTTFCVTV